MESELIKEMRALTRANVGLTQAILALVQELGEIYGDQDDADDAADAPQYLSQPPRG